MNYSALTIDELIHYAGLDAKTDLEVALLAAITSKPTLTQNAIDRIEKICTYLDELDSLASDAKWQIDSLRSDLQS